MKKTIFVCLIGILFSLSIYGDPPYPLVGTRVYLSTELYYDKPVSGTIPIPKSPIEAPTVSIDGHTLYLYGVDFDLTLQLVDENDDVVYTVFVPANTSSVVLPSTLTGEFELQLIPTTGIYYFVSDITL